jgi:hypothetical protein
VTGRNAGDLSAASHALEGVAANLSAIRLFEAAAALERIGAEARMEAAGAAWQVVSVEAVKVVDALHRHTSAEDPYPCAS